MTCEECTTSIQAMNDQLLAEEMINSIAGVISDPHGEICSGATDVDRCSFFADIVIRKGLPLLVSDSDSSQFPAICNIAVPGTCPAKRVAKLF